MPALQGRMGDLFAAVSSEKVSSGDHCVVSHAGGGDRAAVGGADWAISTGRAAQAAILSMEHYRHSRRGVVPRRHHGCCVQQVFESDLITGTEVS